MPGDTKPHLARMARRARKAGSIADVRRKMWQAIICAEAVLFNDGSDAATLLRAVHAITQASTAYARIIETGELEARLAALEAEYATKKTP